MVRRLNGSKLRVVRSHISHRRRIQYPCTKYIHIYIYIYIYKYLHILIGRERQCSASVVRIGGDGGATGHMGGRCAQYGHKYMIGMQ